MKKSIFGITLYGIFVALSIIIAGSFVTLLKQKDFMLLFLIFTFSLASQCILCSTCSSSYTLASYISLIPILIVFFFDCFKVKEIIFIFALMCAIGRIGCYFAGCCTGKITTNKTLAIHYDEKYQINKNQYKNNVYVYPTIYIEIILQFLIAYLVYFSSYGIIFYGLLNAALLFLTSLWRNDPRMNTRRHGYIPIISLIAFSLLAYYKKCYKIKSKPKFVLNYIMIPIGILFAIITSYDINMMDLISMPK